MLEVYISQYDTRTNLKIEFNIQQYQIKFIFSMMHVLFLLQQKVRNTLSTLIKFFKFIEVYLGKGSTPKDLLIK